METPQEKGFNMGHDETTLADARKAVLALKRLHPVSSKSESFQTIDDYLECSVARKIELEHNYMTLKNELAQAVAKEARATLDLLELRARVSDAMTRGDIPAGFL